MPSIKELRTWMTTKQAEKALKDVPVSRQTILNMADDGRIRAVKVGGEVWIFDPVSVEAMKQRKSKP